MFLKQLNLTNFRNYTALNLEFNNQPTILIGDNGAGKSNILEAIYFLSTTKSSRVSLDIELIKEGEVFTKIESLISYVIPADDNNSLEITLQNSEGQLSKKLKVNGVPRRVTDFIGNLPAVIFYPSDINMVTGSPSLRRWHLDLSLAQIDSNYKRSLTLYEQVVVSRNRVLKRIREGEGKLDELTYWTDQLLKYGQVIFEKRQQFFEFIGNLNQPLGDFKFEYKPNILSKDRLDQYLSREIASANTLIGPHRDDFSIVFKNKPLAQFGSRGEQRTGTLAFKLSQLEYMSSVLGTRPILLLDDVFSELDASHRAHVTEISKLQQTIISTVELENIPQEFLDSSRIIKVENGKITE